MTRNRIFVAASLGLLLVGAGCTSNPNAPASVSGVIKYNGQPLKGGTVAFHGKDGAGGGSAPIQEDGSYSIVDIAAGEMIVTVDTESIKDKKSDEQTYGGDRARQQNVQEYAPPGLPSRPAQGKERIEATYVKIPLKYRDRNQSDLRTTLSKGKNKYDINLTD